ncbi:MAG TPA: amidohydrolase family protein [Pyrinomonadaceae bacterium]
MTTIYAARWLLPISAPPIENGAVVIEGSEIVAVDLKNNIAANYPNGHIEDFGNAAIIPGLINTHTHLELTAMRGYLEKEEANFLAWLRKLTVARMERMSADDILVSATWGACEAVRAGITAVGDASDSAAMSMAALREVGLRGIVFQESFGPDPNLVKQNVELLKNKIVELRDIETELVRVGVSPHAPYTVCGPQLEMIAEYAAIEKLPLMMHAAESAAEDSLLREGCGLFADGLARRNIEWTTPGISSIQYLKQKGILETQPLLAHCLRVDEDDVETLAETKSKVAHCPKSNAKLGHGRAPFASFLRHGVAVGLGSDSVASNNTCDLLEEARFAALMARSDEMISAEQVLNAAMIGGARCLDSGGGELKAGAQADLAVVSLNGAHQTPSYDPVASLIFSSSGRDVLLTMVAGREVYREGRVLNVDEERLRVRLNEIFLKLRA